jgi:hypothetical protein
MDQRRDAAILAAAILNAAYMVRHYRRPCARAQRAAAVRALGLTVRDAFNQSEDFEPLLAAVCDGLRPHDERPF